MRPSRLFHVFAQRIQTRPRSRYFRTVWIFSHDLAPCPAFVMKLFRSAIESEGDALPVVPIEAAVIQVIRELGRAAGRKFPSFKSPFSLTREFRRRFFSGVAVDE